MDTALVHIRYMVIEQLSSLMGNARQRGEEIASQVVRA